MVSVEFGENNEDANYGMKALELLPGMIVSSQSYRVDSISGASTTCNAVSEAVKKCLMAASK